MLCQISAEHYSPTESIKSLFRRTANQETVFSTTGQPSQPHDSTLPSQGIQWEVCDVKAPRKLSWSILAVPGKLKRQQYHQFMLQLALQVHTRCPGKVISITTVFFPYIQLQFMVASYYRISDCLKQWILLWAFFFFLFWQLLWDFPLSLMAKLGRYEETISVFRNPRGVKKAHHCKGPTT